MLSWYYIISPELTWLLKTTRSDPKTGLTLNCCTNLTKKPLKHIRSDFLAVRVHLAAELVDHQSSNQPLQTQSASCSSARPWCSLMLPFNSWHSRCWEEWPVLRERPREPSPGMVRDEHSLALGRKCKDISAAPDNITKLFRKLSTISEELLWFSLFCFGFFLGVWQQGGVLRSLPGPTQLAFEAKLKLIDSFLISGDWL